MGQHIHVIQGGIWALQHGHPSFTESENLQFSKNLKLIHIHSKDRKALVQKGQDTRSANSEVKVSSLLLSISLLNQTTVQCLILIGFQVGLIKKLMLSI